jgi:NitT/TauT family transport system ATP-binding protein
MLRLTGVDKRYTDGTLALQGLDFTVGEGEFVSLLGPSGCGKSTALRMIAGLSEPSAGEIVWSKLPELGFVFQDPTLMPWRTVFDNVALPLQLAHVSRGEVRLKVLAALRQVGLSEFERSYPRALSGGMRMRVSVARSLVTDPQMLLMDEPFAALDEITRFKLNNDILAISAARRLTSIFVTHSVFESVYLSTRVIVMAPAPGRVFADIPIAAPARRDEAFRTSPEYAGCCREVSAALAAAMAPKQNAAG